jgi:hypothetical protein
MASSQSPYSQSIRRRPFRLAAHLALDLDGFVGVVRVALHDPFNAPSSASTAKESKGDSWRSTIIEERDRLNMHLTKRPGLEKDLGARLAAAGADAVERAIEAD